MGKFSDKFEKKYKIVRSFARLVSGGVWHVVVDEGKTLFFPCQHYGWFGGMNEIGARRAAGIFRGPYDGYIFTKSHKICGTCMKMKNNQKFLKEVGFIT